MPRQPVAQEALQAQTGTQGLSLSSALGGQTPPGGALDGGEPEPEPEALVFRDFVHNGETYRIVDGRVLVGFKNPPEPPQMDPNYYDVERSDHDPLIETLCPIVEDIPEVAAFIQAENLTVYADWPPAKAIAVILPEGMTVEDAIANWPTEYPDLIEAVEPDYEMDCCTDWPTGPPNDDEWDGYVPPSLRVYWNLREDQDHDINIQQAWRSGYLGYPSEVIAIIDTGVQRSHPDLGYLATAYGFNVSDCLVDTTCTLGGGEPRPDVCDRNAETAMWVGHGTCLAGIACARINNDGDGILGNGNDFCGISYANRYLPIAMEYYPDSVGHPHLTGSEVCNSFAIAAIVKRIVWNYIGSDTWPYYNIEVVNCSFGNYTWSFYVASRLLAWLTPYAVVVAAAGNDGGNHIGFYPAQYIGVMCIAAHDRTDVISDYNYPAWTALIAPSKVMTTDMWGVSASGYPLGFNSDPGCYGCYPFGGTSAAAPHVSAVAAMMASAHRDWSPAQIVSHLKSSAIHDLPGDHYHKGRLNAYGALAGQ